MIMDAAAEAIGWIPRSYTGMLAIAIVIGGAIAWFANREARKRTSEANGETVKANRNTIDAMERQVKAITEERDDYRMKLHNEKETHQAALLRMKELEMRPDLTTLFQSSERFYAEQTLVSNKHLELIAGLTNSFNTHAGREAERMKPILESLATIGTGITELLRRSEQKK